MNLERLKDHSQRREGHPTFSVQEMERRVTALRKEMADTGVDAALFTAPQHQLLQPTSCTPRSGASTASSSPRTPRHHLARTSTPASPGGAASATTSSTPTGSGTTTSAPSRPCWPTPASAGRLGVEDDHIRRLLRAKVAGGVPGVELVDIRQTVMRQRMIKSAEEIAVIRHGARIGDLGGAAVVAAIRDGVPEYEVALAGTQAMVREIARTLPGRRTAGHLGVVPVRDQHRRRPQLGHLPPVRARRHPVA